MALQDIFLVRDNTVIVQKDGHETYTDTIDNFKLDSGVNLNYTDVDYNKYAKFCLINGATDKFPNAEFDGYLDNIDLYVSAQDKRVKSEQLSTMSLSDVQGQNVQEVKLLIKELNGQPVESSLGFRVGFNDDDLKLYAARIATMDDSSTAELTDYDGIKRYNITKSNFITLQREAYAEYLKLLSIQDDYISRINAATDKESALAVISEIKSLVEN